MHPPKRAIVVRSIRFRLPGIDEVGEVRLLDGSASDGFKTDYHARPARWLEVSLPQPPKRPRRKCWRFSGRRYETSDRAWREVVADLKRHQAVILD